MARHRRGWAPAGRPAVQILSIVFTVGWVLLGSVESSKGENFGSLYLQLVCRSTLPLSGQNSGGIMTGVPHLSAAEPWRCSMARLYCASTWPSLEAMLK